MRQILTRSAQKAAMLNSNKSSAGSLSSTPRKTSKQIQKPASNKLAPSLPSTFKTKANGNKPRQNLPSLENTKQQTTRAQSKLHAVSPLVEGLPMQLSTKGTPHATPCKPKRREESFSRGTTPFRKAISRASDDDVNKMDSDSETKIAKLKTKYNTELDASDQPTLQLRVSSQGTKVELGAHSASTNTLDESISFDSHTPVQPGPLVVPQYKSALAADSKPASDSAAAPVSTSEFVSGTSESLERVHPETPVGEPSKNSQISTDLARQHPPTQITPAVVASRPFDSLGHNDCGELWARTQEHSFDHVQEKIDSRVRNKELAYSNFALKQSQLLKYVSQNEFKKIQNQVSLGLVYYDPHFDFRPGFDPLMNHINRFLNQPAPCQVPHYPAQCEVRYYPRCGGAYHGMPQQFNH